MTNSCDQNVIEETAVCNLLVFVEVDALIVFSECFTEICNPTRDDVHDVTMNESCMSALNLDHIT